MLFPENFFQDTGIRRNRFKRRKFCCITASIGLGNLHVAASKQTISAPPKQWSPKPGYMCVGRGGGIVVPNWKASALISAFSATLREWEGMKKAPKRWRSFQTGGGGARCCNNAQFELGREAEEIHFRQSPPSFHIARGFRGSKVSRGFLRWQKCTLKLLVSPFHPCRISHIRKCKNGETKWQTIRLRALSHAFS